MLGAGSRLGAKQITGLTFSTSHPVTSERHTLHQGVSVGPSLLLGLPLNFSGVLSLWLTPMAASHWATVKVVRLGPPKWSCFAAILWLSLKQLISSPSCSWLNTQVCHTLPWISSPALAGRVEGVAFGVEPHAVFVGYSTHGFSGLVYRFSRVLLVLKVYLVMMEKGFSS